MAQITFEELLNLYGSLNSILSNMTNNTIATTAPVSDSAGDKAVAADINNFFNKLTEMKSDANLKNATYPSYSLVSSGTKITTAIKTTMTSAVSSAYLGSVVCNNKATNKNGTCGSGTCSSGTNSKNGLKSNIGFTARWKSDGCSSQGSMAKFGFNSNGNCDSGTCNSGTCSSGTVVDLKNSLTTKTNTA